MKILFAFENPLPSAEADAEVFVTTAEYLAQLTERSWLHVPANCGTANKIAGIPVVRAWAPFAPAALRHICSGLTLVLRRAFRQADLVYTRNLWVAWIAVLFGQKVVFDHYRPWPDQIPPLRPWIYGLFCHPRFLVGICHSNYTRQKYLELGIPDGKLICVHNGFEPGRFHAPLPREDAKRAISVTTGQKTVVYTGRINHKKGLSLVIAAAKRLPDVLFLLVGSYGEGPIEKLAHSLSNVRIVPFQPAETLGQYIFAADVLLIPPSLQPLAEFGSTVLPLKLFSYLASGRTILAGDTPDIREVLRHGDNAFLCAPDNVESLVAAIGTLVVDTAMANRIGMAALRDSRNFTWDTRARRIAGLVAERLHAAPAERGQWGKTQSAVWLRQSRRWLVHLVRNRSWVLPPPGISSPRPPAMSSARAPHE